MFQGQQTTLDVPLTGLQLDFILWHEKIVLKTGHIQQLLAKFKHFPDLERQKSGIHSLSRISRPSGKPCNFPSISSPCSSWHASSAFLGCISSSLSSHAARLPWLGSMGTLAPEGVAPTLEGVVVPLGYQGVGAVEEACPQGVGVVVECHLVGAVVEARPGSGGGGGMPPGGGGGAPPGRGGGGGGGGPPARVAPIAAPTPWFISESKKKRQKTFVQLQHQYLSS